jgi:hypothetical protein
MFARVTRFQGSPDRLGEGARLIEEHVIPAARQTSGFKGGYWLADRQTGRGFGITLWESEEALRDSEFMGEQSRAQASQAGVTIEGVERYEVIAQA